MKGVDLDKYMANNLIGTPDEVCAKVASFEEAGLEGFFATLFVADTVDEMLEQMRLFARYVLPAFLTCHEPPACRRHRRRGGDGRFDGRTSMSRCRTRHMTPTLT